MVQTAEKRLGWFWLVLWMLKGGSQQKVSFLIISIPIDAQGKLVYTEITGKEVNRDGNLALSFEEEVPQIER